MEQKTIIIAVVIVVLILAVWYYYHTKAAGTPGTANQKKQLTTATGTKYTYFPVGYCGPTPTSAFNAYSGDEAYTYSPMTTPEEAIDICSKTETISGKTFPCAGVINVLGSGKNNNGWPWLGCTQPNATGGIYNSAAAIALNTAGTGGAGVYAVGWV